MSEQTANDPSEDWRGGIESDEPVLREKLRIQRLSESLYSADVYMREVSQIARPPDQTTAELIKVYGSGRQAARKLAAGGLDSETAMSLGGASAAGEQVRLQLVYYHLRYAAFLARLTKGQSVLSSVGDKRQLARLNRFSGGALSLEDRLQAANIGLIKGIKNFNLPDEPLSDRDLAKWFRSFISISIINEVKDAIYAESQLPPELAKKLGTLRRAETDLAQRLGRRPTKAELAAELDWDESLMNRLDKAAVFQRRSSLTDLDDRRLMSHTAAPDQDRLEEDVINREFVSSVLGLLDDHRHRAVLALRYGLLGDAPQTLDDVALILGVSFERVRQIEERALEVIRKKLYQGEGLNRSPESFAMLRKIFLEKG